MLLDSEKSAIQADNQTIKYRLIAMSFMQFFVWGAWLITIGTYCFNAKGWTGAEFGAIFSTLGLSSLFMPAITGIIADKWLNAEKLYGILHILYGIILIYVPKVDDPNVLYYVIFGAMILSAMWPASMFAKRT